MPGRSWSNSDSTLGVEILERLPGRKQDHQDSTTMSDSEDSDAVNTSLLQARTLLNESDSDDELPDDSLLKQVEEADARAERKRMVRERFGMCLRTGLR